MSGWRVARPDELARLWPAVRSAHVAASLAELEDFYSHGPWRVRVSSAGDAMVLARWRTHLDALAIRGLWTVDHRVGGLVDEAKRVAAGQGFGRVLSPLLARSLQGPYQQAGMVEIEPVVALQGIPGRIAMRSADEAALAVRAAMRADLERVGRIDAQCFNEFWLYGPEEFEHALEAERLTVAVSDGEICGYASSSIRGHTCTLGRLAVAPEARRRGAGRALVTDVALWATKSNAAVLSLCTQESNETSRALYASCGLFELDERYGILAAEL